MSKKKILIIVMAFTMILSLTVVPINAMTEEMVVRDAQISDAVVIANSGASITNGIYYLKNYEYDKYMQVDDGDDPDYDTEGSIMELWGFAGEEYQQWEIHLLNNGYYRISNVKSDLALTVPTTYWNADEVSIVQEEFVGDYGQQWYFEETTRGTYVIRPRSGENASTDWCLSSGDGAFTSNGRNVEQRAYTNNSDYKDEWELYLDSTYAYMTLNARILYDTTCTMNSAEMTSRYNEAVEAFLDEFNIEFNLTSVAYSADLDVDSSCYYQNIYDICTAACGLTYFCNTSHHKSAYRLILEATSSYYYTYRLLGYAVCRYDSSQEEQYKHDAIVGAAKINGKNACTSTIVSQNLVRSIQHELTHNLGGKHDDCTNGELCVLKNNLGYWCSSCREAIKNNY